MPAAAVNATEKEVLVLVSEWKSSREIAISQKILERERVEPPAAKDLHG